jgi:hypothetical protein
MCEITHRGLSYGNEYNRWQISRRLFRLLAHVEQVEFFYENISEYLMELRNNWEK